MSGLHGALASGIAPEHGDVLLRGRVGAHFWRVGFPDAVATRRSSWKSRTAESASGVMGWGSPTVVVGEERPDAVECC